MQMAKAAPHIAARREKVAAFYNDGLPLPDIAGLLGVSTAVVTNDVHWLRYHTTKLGPYRSGAVTWSVGSPPAGAGAPVISPGRTERFSPRLTTVEEDLEADVRRLRRERDEAYGELAQAREASEHMRAQRDGARMWGGACVRRQDKALADLARVTRERDTQIALLGGQQRLASQSLAERAQRIARARGKLRMTGMFSFEGRLYRRVSEPVPLVQGSPVLAASRETPARHLRRLHPSWLCATCAEQRRTARRINRT